MVHIRAVMLNNSNNNRHPAIRAISHQDGRFAYLKFCILKSANFEEMVSSLYDFRRLIKVIFVLSVYNSIIYFSDSILNANSNY